MPNRIHALGAILALGVSSATPGESFRLPDPASPAWERVELPGVERATEYRAAEDPEEGWVIAAEARCSASGLIAALPADFDLLAQPILRWRWRAELASAGADERSKPGDDFAARVSVLFPFEPERASWLQRVRIGLGSRLAGREIPGTTLYFVWTREISPGTAWKSPYGSEIQLVALAQGAKTEWQDAEVDVWRAYHEAFGRNPPHPAAVGLMTDSDNHCDHARAWIADLRFTAPE